MATPARTRREEYAEATREAVLDSARNLFSTAGYVGTSLDLVAREARVTKGAVYHHFAHKQALFEALLDRLETETVEVVVGVAAGADNAWDGLLAGLDAFLDRCLDPVYQRICFVEGPVALGFEGWWACGERYEIGVIRTVLAALDAEGLVDVDDLDMLAQLLFGTMTAAAITLARAEDPEATKDRIRDVMIRMMRGLRPDPSSA